MLRENLFFDTLVNVQLIVREIFFWKTAERYFNQIIELNKFLNNVCIFGSTQAIRNAVILGGLGRGKVET
jgi:hypothetical protein